MASSNLCKRPRSLGSNASANVATASASAPLFPPPSLMSPTSSLAADMSQNFHIDRTPALPTPRRALFPCTIQEHSSEDQDTDVDSSPDVSRRSSLASASSMSGSDSTSSLASPVSNDQSSSVSSKAARPTRRLRMKSLSNASFLLQNKPSLSWGLSGDSDFSNSSPQTSSLSLASTSSQFSNCLKIKSPPCPGTPTSEYDEMDIDGYFQPSPMAARLQQQQRPRPPQHVRNSFESPMPSKPNYPCKIRRIQSMFENPQDVTKNDLAEPPVLLSDSPGSSLNNNTPQSILDQKDCKLKTFTVKEDPFRRIERETLCEIMDGKHNDLYDKYMIIDCRFEYEYQGGHIDGAININTKHSLETQLLSNVKGNQKLLLVFHCEYSAHRGPRMAMHLRNCDRHLNMAHYPNLHYPDIVILQGGYSHFFQNCNQRCVPQRYVEMNDHSHRDKCEREMGKFRKTMKFARTQSYTFGSYPSNTDADDTFGSSTPCASTYRFPPAKDNGTPTGPSSRARLVRIHSEKLFA